MYLMFTMQEAMPGSEYTQKNKTNLKDSWASKGKWCINKKWFTRMDFSMHSTGTISYWYIFVKVLFSTICKNWIHVKLKIYMRETKFLEDHIKGCLHKLRYGQIPSDVGSTNHNGKDRFDCIKINYILSKSPDKKRSIHTGRRCLQHI